MTGASLEVMSSARPPAAPVRTWQGSPPGTSVLRSFFFFFFETLDLALNLISLHIGLYFRIQQLIGKQTMKLLILAL